MQVVVGEHDGEGHCLAVGGVHRHPQVLQGGGEQVNHGGGDAIASGFEANRLAQSLGRLGRGNAQVTPEGRHLRGHLGGRLGEVALLHQAVEHKVDVIQGHLALELLGDLLPAVVAIQKGQNLAVELTGKGVVVLLTQQVDLFGFDDFDVVVGFDLEGHFSNK